MKITTAMFLAIMVVGCKSNDASKNAAEKGVEGSGSVSGATTASESTRMVECSFKEFEGEGDDRVAKFAIKNLGKKDMKSAQSWIYYYNADGIQIDRYPHSFYQAIAAGGTTEKTLGRKAVKFKEGTVAAECEITSVTWDDKEKWFNENLVTSGFTKRPKGGLTHEQLVARQGEKVIATLGDIEGERPMFSLHNTSGEALTVRVVWVYYYDAEKKYLKRTVGNFRLKLAAGEKKDQAVGYTSDKAPEGAKYMEAVVTEVALESGDKWLNRNLAPLSGRPMKGTGN